MSLFAFLPPSGILTIGSEYSSGGGRDVENLDWISSRLASNPGRHAFRGTPPQWVIPEPLTPAFPACCFAWCFSSNFLMK